jgi:hypothetical protein
VEVEEGAEVDVGRDVGCAGLVQWVRTEVVGAIGAKRSVGTPVSQTLGGVSVIEQEHGAGLQATEDIGDPDSRL